MYGIARERLAALAFVLAFAGLPAPAAEEAARPRAPGVRDRCPVCGMFVAKFPAWVARGAFDDSTAVFFDGPKDMFKYLLDMPRWAPGHAAQDIVAACVQLNSVEDKRQNLAVASRLVEEAARGGARLVALPEMFNCLGRFEAVLEAAYPLSVTFRLLDLAADKRPSWASALPDTGPLGLDKAVHVRDLALLLLERRLLVGQLLGADVLERRVVASVEGRPRLLDVQDAVADAVEEVAVVRDQ